MYEYKAKCCPAESVRYTNSRPWLGHKATAQPTATWVYWWLRTNPAIVQTLQAVAILNTSISILNKLSLIRVGNHSPKLINIVLLAVRKTVGDSRRCWTNCAELQDAWTKKTKVKVISQEQNGPCAAAYSSATGCCMLETFWKTLKLCSIETWHVS